MDRDSAANSVGHFSERTASVSANVIATTRAHPHTGTKCSEIDLIIKGLCNNACKLPAIAVLLKNNGSTNQKAPC